MQFINRDILKELFDLPFMIKDGDTFSLSLTESSNITKILKLKPENRRKILKRKFSRKSQPWDTHVVIKFSLESEDFNIVDFNADTII